MFDKLKSRYIFKGTLVLASGLHIGGGRLSPVTGSDSPVMKDFDGLPFIPGSSFKGVLRSALESLLRGLDGYSSLRSCDVVSEAACIRLEKKYNEEVIECWQDDSIIASEKKKTLLDKNNRQYETFIFNHSCPICRLFGSPFLGSKLFFKDLRARADTFSRIEIRDFVAIERDTETAKHQGKFDAEVVPVGTEFDIEIVAENPEDYELGLLFTGFDMLNNGEAMLGGLTSRGLGRVEIRWNEIVKKDCDSFLQGTPGTIYKEKIEEALPSAEPEPKAEERPEVKKPDTDVPLEMVRYAISKLERDGEKTDGTAIGKILATEFKLNKAARFQKKLPEKLADFLNTFIPEHLEMQSDGQYKLFTPPKELDPPQEKDASPVPEEKQEEAFLIEELRVEKKALLLEKYHCSVQKREAEDA